MEFRELAVPGAWEFTPRQFPDERGTFLEWFKEPALVKVVGHTLRLAQANLSVSGLGVLRGIHFADVPPGQAKYVTCVSGSVLDVTVDLRTGSPNFGTWDSVVLDEVARRAVYISEGLGHAFVSLTDTSTVVYACSEEYAPEREHAVHALDNDLGIAWPTEDLLGRPLSLRLSEKDQAAPRLSEARSQGVLPRISTVENYINSLRH